MLAKAKNGLANIQTPILDTFLSEKIIGSPKELTEKKNVLGQNGDEITPIDGT